MNKNIENPYCSCNERVPVHVMEEIPSRHHTLTHPTNKRINQPDHSKARSPTMQTFLQEEDHPLALRESLHAVLEGSTGTSMFRTLYRARDGVLDDVISDGDLACAFFVSTILSMFGLILNGVHTTVRMTLNDMEESEWLEVGEPEALAVVLWGEKQGDDGRPHFHIGICLDDTYAIEHSAVTKCPRQIRITDLKMPDGSPRPPIAYFVHPKLKA